MKFEQWKKELTEKLTAIGPNDLNAIYELFKNIVFEGKKCKIQIQPGNDLTNIKLIDAPVAASFIVTRELGSKFGCNYKHGEDGFEY